MNKQLILNKYSKPEDKLLISKMLDKAENSISKNKIQYTDFLDLYQQQLLSKILKQEKIENYKITGGIESSERNIILFYPEKLKTIVNDSKKILPIICIRIKLPKEMYNKYNHRDYLGGLLKLGIKREKIGDILVFEDGADILILEEISKFITNNINALTRFGKSNIEVIELQDIREKKINTKEIQIIIPSLRIDAVVAELAKTSRGKAEELLEQGRIFLNYEEIQKTTKQIKENDILTIRGKGKFIIGKQEGTTKNGRIKIAVQQFV